MEDKQWYVVNTYSGHENKVKEKLEMRIESLDMQDYIFRVIVPEAVEIEVKDGKEKEKIKKLFPGYVLIEMIMTDQAWYAVRNTPGVTGFLGSSGKGAKPFPLFPHEVDHILSSMGMSRIKLGDDLVVGDRIQIIEGPFKSMLGRVLELDVETGQLTVSIDLFGQETTVEVELAQVKKE